jgi:predicted RNA-binding protein with PIN domain
VASFDTQHKNEINEELALINEDFLDTHLSGEEIEDNDIASLISERRLFPIVFGSALKTEGVKFLIKTIDKYSLEPIYEGKDFGAKIYKISRQDNTRLTYMKITSGTIKARDEISYLSQDGRRITEKISQIRLYSGDKYEQVESASAGDICAVIGLSATYIGQGLGMESDTNKPILEPVLSYRIILPNGCDPNLYFPKLKELEEEEPSLHLYWNEELKQIEARLMGEIQIDLIKRLILERYNIECEFGAGKILYKEKISSKAIGVGHFEPLRHYAEVQLLIEPQPKGTGLIFDTNIPENMLATNWQRLILTHLYEKNHRGILIGAFLTDTKITLIAGKAHLKHTEGGDFRQATFRAVRHGLMKGGCTLLEPYYKFRLEIPSPMIGRAMNDLQMRFAEFEIEENEKSMALICGRAPVATIHDYVAEVISYTRGEGKLTCVADGYDECHNQDEIVEKSGYDPESDLRNPPHSVFCERGAGFVVNWRDVDSMKHIDIDININDQVQAVIPKVSTLAKKYSLSDDELEAIMLREFGPIRRKKYSEPKVISAGKSKPNKKAQIKQESLVIVDGYNLIYAWDTLKEIADFSLEKARESLMDILSSYVAYTKEKLVLVFDAYLVNEGVGSDFTHDGYRVVYTKENQTADAFIEKMMHELGPNYKIRVVTGDRLVQFAAVHSGISRMTTKEFSDELIRVGNEITDFVKKLAENQ